MSLHGDFLGNEGEFHLQLPSRNYAYATIQSWRSACTARAATVNCGIRVRPDQYASALSFVFGPDLELLVLDSVTIFLNCSASLARPRARWAFRVPSGTPNVAAAFLMEKSSR